MEDIVVAGMSGRLPESDNLEEFWENLINGVDMVTEDDRRWTPGEKALQCCVGPKQTTAMNPICLLTLDLQMFGFMVTSDVN